jgi:hypothetical protein
VNQEVILGKNRKYLKEKEKVGCLLGKEKN